MVYFVPREFVAVLNLVAVHFGVDVVDFVGQVLLEDLGISYGISDRFVVALFGHVCVLGLDGHDRHGRVLGPLDRHLLLVDVVEQPVLPFDQNDK